MRVTQDLNSFGEIFAHVPCSIDENIYIYYTLRFYFPYLSLLAQPVNIIYLLTGYEGIASLLSPRH